MIKMVEIVNGNGRKGMVAATSPAARALRRPPSAQVDEEQAPPVPDLPVNLGPEMPAKNASKEAWVGYAADPRTPNGLSTEDAEQMSRDELVDHFNPSEED